MLFKKSMAKKYGKNHGKNHINVSVVFKIYF